MSCGCKDLNSTIFTVCHVDKSGRIYFYTGRWSYRYETIRYLYPGTSGIDRSREHGEYSLERIDSGPVTYLMLPPYADDIDTLKETLPGGKVVEEFGFLSIEVIKMKKENYIQDPRYADMRTSKKLFDSKK